MLNANVFFTQWVDQQVDTNLGIPNDNVTVNAGESELYGFEIQANHFPESIQGLEVYSTFGYVNTGFKEFVLLGEDLSGNRFPHASDFSLNVGGELLLPGSLVCRRQRELSKRFLQRRTKYGRE